MTLKGIDISSWQYNLKNPAKLDIDFCIIKATEGTSYVNPYCDAWIQRCITAKKLFGYYHFAHSTPKSEARYFWNHTVGYTGMGIPVIDYEAGSANARNYLETFCTEYHKISGIWPMVYISALSDIGKVSDLKGSWIPEKCGLWLAGYPKDYSTWPTKEKIPYDISPWNTCAIWQFASDYLLSGYDGYLDANIAYMDANGWLKYAGTKTQSIEPDKRKSCDELADEVIAGKWGNGKIRKQKLDSAYGKGTYDHVQIIVNRKLSLDGC